MDKTPHIFIALRVIKRKETQRTSLSERERNHLCATATEEACFTQNVCCFLSSSSPRCCFCRRWNCGILKLEEKAKEDDDDDDDAMFFYEEIFLAFVVEIVQEEAQETRQKKQRRKRRSDRYSKRCGGRKRRFRRRRRVFFEFFLLDDTGQTTTTTTTTTTETAQVVQFESQYESRYRVGEGVD